MHRRDAPHDRPTQTAAALIAAQRAFIMQLRWPDLHIHVMASNADTAELRRVLDIGMAVVNDAYDDVLDEAGSALIEGALGEEHG